MSGLEVGAVIAGVISASAGTVSAYKDMKKRRELQGVSGFNQTQTWTVRIVLSRPGISLVADRAFSERQMVQNGRIETTERKICLTKGFGDAGVNANGDVYARSSGGGSATAVHFKQKTINSSGNRY